MNNLKKNCSINKYNKTMTNKIVRSICIFDSKPSGDSVKTLAYVESVLLKAGFQIQTKRLCTKPTSPFSLDRSFGNIFDRIAIGRLSLDRASKYFDEFINSDMVNFTMDLTEEAPTIEHLNLLKRIIKIKPSNTFNFSFVFNNENSSPYFPSAQYERDGFSIGLELTDLAEKSLSLRHWFSQMETVWKEIYDLFKDDKKFLGIDSSIAPLFYGKSSLINFVKRLGLSFPESCLSDIYTQITRFIKSNNPKPVGLCGLMLPCLEDFELADEYEKGNFDIKTNLFLSLHSGLGIDTYPIGIDEKDNTIISIIKLVQALSQKYTKPLSIRFVSDGKAKIGERTDFQNKYLKDVTIKPLITL